MLLGDFILLVGILVWLAITVGPWWIAPLLFIITHFINKIVIKLLERRVEEEKLKSLEQLKNIMNKLPKEKLEE